MPLNDDNKEDDIVDDARCCIKKGREYPLNYTSACGNYMFPPPFFMDAEHAIAAAKYGSRLYACPLCAKELNIEGELFLAIKDTLPVGNATNYKEYCDG